MRGFTCVFVVVTLLLLAEVVQMVRRDSDQDAMDVGDVAITIGSRTFSAAEPEARGNASNLSGNASRTRSASTAPAVTPNFSAGQWLFNGAQVRVAGANKSTKSEGTTGRVVGFYIPKTGRWPVEFKDTDGVDKKMHFRTACLTVLGHFQWTANFKRAPEQKRTKYNSIGAKVGKSLSQKDLEALSVEGLIDAYRNGDVTQVFYPAGEWLFDGVQVRVAGASESTKSEGKTGRVKGFYNPDTGRWKVEFTDSDGVDQKMHFRTACLTVLGHFQWTKVFEIADAKRKSSYDKIGAKEGKSLSQKDLEALSVEGLIDAERTGVVVQVV